MDSIWASAISSSALHKAMPSRTRLRAAGLALCCAIVAPVSADKVFVEPATFVAEAFGGKPPAPQKLWVTALLNEQVRAIVGSALPALRQKYWREGERTVWILEAIGRDKPITAGYVVEHGAIARTAILVYRESRGAEVRHAFFTDQFTGATLHSDDTLDRKIDGITGATLSVHAISGLARVALLLDRAARLSSQ